MGQCSDLFARIDALQEKYIAVWEDVCRIESPTQDKEGVDRVGGYFIDMAKKRGWQVEVLPQPVSGDCVCITMNPDSKEAPVVFSGHMDTVHPIGSFGEQVVTRDAEKIYGPAVLDCKGGIVAAFCAMEALAACGFTRRPVMLLLQSDEETGSQGSGKATIRFLCEKAKDCIAFLNCEGHVKGRATVARKGISRYEFEVIGRASHSSKCFEGASAIREAAYKLIELEQMKEPDGLTCNCGVIAGGTAANTVADRCVFTADIRFSTLEEMERSDRFVQEIAEKAHVEGTSCNVTLKSRRCPMERTEANLALLDAVNAIYAEEGLVQLAPAKRSGGSDAADVTAYGLPCLDSMGVQGDFIHSRKEYAYLKSLAEGAKNLAAVAFRI